MAIDRSSNPPSSQRANWAAKHPVVVGLLTGLLGALAGVLAFNQSLSVALIVSSLVGVVVWLGWRPRGWLRRIEERNHRLDIN